MIPEKHIAEFNILIEANQQAIHKAIQLLQNQT